MNKIRSHVIYPVIEEKEVPQKTKAKLVINTFKTFRAWSEKENEYLKKVYSSTPISLIAEHLKRTVSSVSHQASRLGIVTIDRGSKSHRVKNTNWDWRKAF